MKFWYERYESLPDDYLRGKIKKFLEEDLPNGDLTTDAIFGSEDTVCAKIIAQERLVFAGKRLLELFFEDAKVKVFKEDGRVVKNTGVIAEIEGSATYVLKRERTALNLLQRLCGIATKTKTFSEIGDPYRCKILDTRKTTPGLRLLEKYAVAVGGGYNHRLDLSSGILIKDNHIKAAGGIKAAVEKIRAMNYDRPIEVEVDDASQLEETLDLFVDGILLDNMTPLETTDAVATIREWLGGDKYFVEASGGVNETNVAEYVRTGVNGVSCGALTHSVKSSELHMEFY